MKNKIKIKGNQYEEIEGLYSDYPYVMHRANLQDVEVPWHWHEEVEIGYVEKGNLVIITAGGTRTLKQGEGFFMNGNVLSTMHREKEEETIVISHIFHPVLLGGHFKSIFETKYLDPILDDRNLDLLELTGENERQQKLLLKLQKLTKLQKEENSEFQTRNLLSEIWLLIIDEAKEKEESRRQIKHASQDRIQSMMAYIQQNYAQKLSLQDIADAALIGKRECIRCFQNVMQKTPFEYLLEYRILMAEKLLESNEQSVTEIAINTGFSNSAYFGKIFKKIKGVTPGQFRKMKHRNL